MRTLFADSGYYIALLNPRDQWHGKAKTVTAQLGNVRVVTSQMVFVEFLNFMGGRGQQLRESAWSALRDFAENPDVEIVPQSSAQFDSAVDLYNSRPDQRWSLTDCASFLLKESQNIQEALAYDRDFEQAGFVALLR